MVHAGFPEPHGAREDTTRRTVTPELAAVLAAARRRRGWSLREAARNVQVAYGTIAHLEKARRAPSIIVAENLIRAYRLTGAEARMLLAEAVEGAGKDSPFKKDAPVMYGARRFR
jgi:transcriptional regulator with XRE-family HTH domain